MGKIYYLIGKSASGKDSLLEALLSDTALGLSKIVQYTTRPIRDNEKEGREYHFITDEEADRMDQEGRIVEMRSYDTVHGIWKYMLADDGISGSPENRAAVGTIESYIKVRDYFGKDRVVPLYIWVEDGQRLRRALEREELNAVPKYEEMCRRFLADQKDFSDERLKMAGIMDRNGQYVNGFENDDFASCLQKITEFVKGDMRHGSE